MPLTTLDQSPLTDWERIDLMIMDTEGFEAHAMRGGRLTLARTRYFCVEYAPEQLQSAAASRRLNALRMGVCVGGTSTSRLRYSHTSPASTASAIARPS